MFGLLWAAPSTIFLQQLPASLGTNAVKISRTGCSTPESRAVPEWHLLVCSGDQVWLSDGWFHLTARTV